MDYQQIAAICHEANRLLCGFMGDWSQPGWETAPKWQRDSALAGVEFNAANPSAPPSASHESWFAQKVADGWVYGAEKDPELKQHPCMVPYEQLPPMQQAKDHLFKAICGALVPFATKEA